ncbi:MAG: stage 0 sporulation family protein [Oscillospiraceae bacterium]|nr:stage 0 sporulation family protein [Oscillospiraceae bacterium]
MTEIISVRFKSGGKEYYFDPRGTAVRPGDPVIIETAKGPEFGTCCLGNTMVEDEKVVQPLRPLLRLATEKDLDTLQHNREREKEAMRICQEKVEEHELDMSLVRCECSFDGNKLLFFFTSEGRVDFRALVKDLATTLHSRIELRQIGVRDESKLLGGLGICGRPYCCNAFLEQFHPVSIKMAKTQGLSLNPTKISGACGRLMCCLKYEQEAYEDAVKRLPKNESFVETPDGVGTVTDVDFLRERVKVRLENAPETPQTYVREEINIVRNGKGRRPEGYVAPPPQELEKLRKVTPRLMPATSEPRELSADVDAALAQMDPNRKGSRRRGDRPRQENRPKQEGKPKPKQPPKAQTPKAQAPKAAVPASKNQGEKPKEGHGRNHRRRHRSGGKPKSGGQE